MTGDRLPWAGDGFGGGRGGDLGVVADVNDLQLSSGLFDKCSEKVYLLIF